MGIFERHRYPKNWDELSLACKERAGWCCEDCGVRQKETRIGKISGKEYVVYLSACHVNHDPENPDAQLACLCQACHLKMDGLQHARVKKRHDGERSRSNQRAAGQIDLPSWDEAAG